MGKNSFQFASQSIFHSMTTSSAAKRQSRNSSKRKSQTALNFQKLEDRNLLSAESLLPATSAAIGGQDQAFVSPGSNLHDQAAGQSVTPVAGQYQLVLPNDVPASFSVDVPFDGNVLTLNLDKNSVYGENTRLLIDDGSGELKEFDLGEDLSYIGSVEGHPDYAVSAVLGENGLMANIIRPQLASIVITPIQQINLNGLHAIALDADDAQAPDGDDEHDEHGEHEGHDHAEDQTAASVGATTVESNPTSSNAASPVSLPATLAPTRVTDILEFEIGVEIGSRAFFASTAYNGNLQTAQNTINMIVGNLDARFLHSAGIKHRLGTTIIRTDSATDPLRNSVTATGGAPNAIPSLNAFRDYWNNNPNEVGDTHDLAVYHVLSAPSGLAYVNSVGGNNRYATSGGNGATSWANGTLAHEFGHSWGLAHVNQDNQFYESRPRDNNGSNAAGGEERFFSIMDGRGRHNIGRLATSEADIVTSNRNARRSLGDPVSGIPVKPFGAVDRITVVGSEPTTIDVINNDYDVNNDVLDVQLLDTVSFLGGTVELSFGTGPGGRDELIYTAPASASGSEDFFNYTVVDSTGRTDFGAVHIEISGPVSVDLGQSRYFYDLGQPDSIVFEDYTQISEETFGAYGFETTSSAAIESRDRGSGPGVNGLNRDHIRLRGTAEFHHELANGIYDVLLTVGDANENTDPFRITAEGNAFIDTAAHTPSEFLNYRFNNVEITDGELNLEFTNLGFSANLTRINIFKIQEQVTVDTTETEFIYDIGDADSALFSNVNGDNYVRLPHFYTGDIEFVGGNPQSFDRGTGSGVNDINRDGIVVDGATTFTHTLSNGVWEVLVNIGDRDFARDNISISAEGESVATDINRAAGEFGPNIIFPVSVADGQLNLSFTDSGGVNSDISMTRIILRRLSDLPPSEIVGRHVFYNDSSFDGGDQNANASDDAAIATNKVALLPGETATFANYTSYVKGINGIIVDVENLPNASALSASDFSLLTGNGSDPNDFTVLATAPTVSVRVGAGENGSDRVTLTLPDGTVTGQWLNVTILANGSTGLNQNDSFYFGNAVGDTGDSTTDARVGPLDESGVRNNNRNFFNPADVEDVYDFDRNGVVAPSDENLVRINSTNLFSDLKLITAPSIPLGQSVSAAATSAPASSLPIVTQAATVDDLTVSPVITYSANGRENYTALSTELPEEDIRNQADQPVTVVDAIEPSTMPQLAAASLVAQPAAAPSKVTTAVVAPPVAVPIFAAKFSEGPMISNDRVLFAQPLTNKPINSQAAKQTATSSLYGSYEDSYTVSNDTDISATSDADILESDESLVDSDSYFEDYADDTF